MKPARLVTVELTVLCDAGFSDELLERVLRERCEDLGLPVKGSRICNQTVTEKLPKTLDKRAKS